MLVFRLIGLDPIMNGSSYPSCSHSLHDMLLRRVCIKMSTRGKTGQNLTIILSDYSSLLSYSRHSAVTASVVFLAKRKRVVEYRRS